MSETGHLETFKLFINGKSVDALSGKTFDSLNPYTGEPWARLADGGPADVDLAVEAARAAFDGSWGATTGKNGQLKATFYMSLHPARERYRDTATCKWGSL